jgi:hypothetical protein
MSLILTRVLFRQGQILYLGTHEYLYLGTVPRYKPNGTFFPSTVLLNSSFLIHFLDATKQK